MHASRFEYRTNTTTSDNTGTSCRWAKENLATVELAQHFVWDRVTLELYWLEVLTRLLSTLANRFRNFVCLAVTDADLASLVPRYYERGEAETTTTLNDLGTTIDEYYLFGNAIIFALFALTARSATIAAWTAIATWATIATWTTIATWATWATVTTWTTWAAVATWTRTTWSACVLL